MPGEGPTGGNGASSRLNVLGLVSGYGKSTIVDGVSLDVKQDTITLLIGIATSIFTGVFVSRVFFDWQANRRGFDRVSI